VDVEDWYHPEYVRSKAFSRWEGRIQQSLKATLDILNVLGLNATFFVVGELAEKRPEIIENIRENNHEIAFHGYSHEPLWKLDAKGLRKEIDRFNCLIKEKCSGFRAPSFSLNNKTRWALKVLKDSGYRYDSSLFPAFTPLYGVWNAPTAPYKPSFENVTRKDENSKLWEFPLMVYTFKGIRVPVAGGFYLRFFPVNLLAKAIKRLNSQGVPATIFFHNWELDPQTPRLELGFFKYFVTYYNLKSTLKKLQRLLSSFQFTSVKEFMESHLS
jgi:polysaccharide deacetylase family protein (PEP-CTERM system associated)